ncbi:MAG: hypothetical protein R2722_07175 [Tessaracoccus sp.]
MPRLLLTGLPAAYLGFLFFAFLLYSTLYNAVTGRRGRPVDAVIVLGCGLLGGERESFWPGDREGARGFREKSRTRGREP